MGKPRGLPKSGGRTAGTPNKIGKDLRPLLEAEVEALIPEINKIWNELSSVEKARFLPSLLRLVMPNQVELSSPTGKSAVQQTIEQFSYSGDMHPPKKQICLYFMT